MRLKNFSEFRKATREIYRKRVKQHLIERCECEIRKERYRTKSFWVIIWIISVGQWLRWDNACKQLGSVKITAIIRDFSQLVREQDDLFPSKISTNYLKTKILEN